jgi:hypothetical protein
MRLLSYQNHQNLVMIPRHKTLKHKPNAHLGYTTVQNERRWVQCTPPPPLLLLLLIQTQQQETEQLQLMLIQTLNTQGRELFNLCSLQLYVC